MVRWMPVLLCLVACESSGTVSIVETGDTDTDTDTDVDTDTEPVPECDPYAISVEERLLVDHGSRVDGIQLPAPEPENAVKTRVSVNTSSECGLDLRNGLVWADAWVGPDGYPDVVICTSRSGTLEGDPGILDAVVPLVSEPLPDDLPASGGDKLMDWGDEATFTVDRVFDSLRLQTRAALTIDGELDILVTDTLELNQGTLTLTPGSTLDLWVTGQAQVVWGSQVNVEGDPRALRVHLLDGATLEMGQGAQLWARVSGPESVVTVGGRDTRLVGSLQAAEARLEWGAELRMPEDLLCD